MWLKKPFYLVQLLGLIATGCAVNSKTVPVRSYQVSVVGKQSYEEYVAKGLFPNLFSFKEQTFAVRRQNGALEEVRDFLQKSAREQKAIAYVKEKIEEARKRYETKDMSPLELAVASFDIIRLDISRSGKGVYTSKHEYRSEITIHFKRLDDIMIDTTLKTKGIGDSVQSLAEFTTKGVNGRYYGDCDDFAASLLIAYEIMVDIAKKETDAFLSKLYKGLQHYQIVGVYTTNHALNAKIIYSNDFSKATIVPIEPQIFKKNNLSFVKENGIVYIYEKNVAPNKVSYIFNSKIVYRQETK